MANELTISLELEYVSGQSKTRLIEKKSKRFTVVGSLRSQGVQSIGTSEEAIGLNSVVNLGFAYFENLDSTNFVEIRPATAVADCIRLNAGEFCFLRLAADAAPFAIADTAAVDLQFIIWET